MTSQLRREWREFIAAVRRLDPQTAFVLVAAALFALIQATFGGRHFFSAEFSHLFGREFRELAGWAWWFGLRGLTGFILPALCLRLIFKRSAAEMGLGLGDWKLARTIVLVYLPLAFLGAWVLSGQAAFQVRYPPFRPAAFHWGLFFTFEAFSLFYWIGWEYLWRGFVLFGTARTFGVYAIFIQMVPFAMLHYGKPLPEAILSIAGGLAVGALVWRCRAFWIAVPLHVTQIFALDFWCALRHRTGISGIGPEDLIDLLRGWLG